MATYAKEADYKANQGKSSDLKLYIPGKTVMGKGDNVLGGTAVFSDQELNGANRIAGYDLGGTASAYNEFLSNQPSPSSNPSPAPNNSSEASYLASTNNGMTSVGNGNYTNYERPTVESGVGGGSVNAVANTAAEIKAAQEAALATMKEGYDNRLAAQLQTYNTERAKIPEKTTVANNETSARGKVNAQQIRNALAQMGLLQSGESASQQLANDIGVSNNINSNNSQGRALDASYADKIAAAISQNAVDYINAAYQIGRDTTNDRQWGQTFAQQQAQDTFNNAINATNATGYAPKTIQDLYPGWATSNTAGGVSTGKVYGTAGDRILNPSIELYVPGVTQLSPNDTFLGGTAVLPDSALNGAQRIAGYTAQETSDKYKNALANGTVRAKSSSGGSVYYNPS